jgi:hypothetical protein
MARPQSKNQRFVKIQGINFIILSSQNVCIRRADGYCCIQYQVCGDQTNPFTLDRKNTYSAPLAGLVENSCTVDYIAIPSKYFKHNNFKVIKQFFFQMFYVIKEKSVFLSNCFN